MAEYLSFLCIYFNRTYWPDFGLNILLYFAHGSEVRKIYWHWNKKTENSIATHIFAKSRGLIFSNGYQIQINSLIIGPKVKASFYLRRGQRSCSSRKGAYDFVKIGVEPVNRLITSLMEPEYEE